MASETFVSAMLLVTGVVAASILIVAVLPMIWGMVGTFSSASAATDKTMRTDFKIVTTYAKITSGSGYLTCSNVSVWIKNIGTTRISANDLKLSDVVVGKSDSFYRATLSTNTPPWPAARATSSNYQTWYYYIYDVGTINNIWEPGETLQIDTFAKDATTSGTAVYFQFTLPSGVSRSAEFTTS